MLTETEKTEILKTLPRATFDDHEATQGSLVVHRENGFFTVAQYRFLGYRRDPVRLDRDWIGYATPDLGVALGYLQEYLKRGLDRPDHPQGR